MCEELSSHMLRASNYKNRKPWLSVELINDTEARYMDLSALIIEQNENVQNTNIVLMVAACSDGLLR